MAEKQLTGNLLVFIWILQLHQIFCQNGTSPATDTPLVITSETVIFGFRLWQIVAIALTLVLIIIVICCCLIDCRIPRNKAEIDADYEKKQRALRYENELSHIHVVIPTKKQAPVKPVVSSDQRDGPGGGTCTLPRQTGTASGTTFGPIALPLPKDGRPWGDRGKKPFALIHNGHLWLYNVKQDIPKDEIIRELEKQYPEIRIKSTAEPSQTMKPGPLLLQPGLK